MAWRQVRRSARGAGRPGPRALLDIGSSKICCYIVLPAAGRGFTLAGRGYQAAEGFDVGNVIDMDLAARSIAAVLHEAELEAGAELREVAVTWSGGAPRSHLVEVQRFLGGREFNDDDLSWMLERARSDGEQDERVSVHVAPVETRLDDGRTLRDARGLGAGNVTLLASVTTVDRQALADLEICLEQCHVGIEAVVSSGYAAGMACVTQEEAERGCLVLEFGGGTTDIAHFHAGRLVHVAQVAFGGDHVSRDIAFGLDTSPAYAERLKNLYGSVQWRSCDDNMRIDVPLIGDTIDMPTGEIPRTRLTLIVRSRVEEILSMVQDELRDAWNLYEKRPPRSIVLTGGGAQVEGLVEFVEELFGLPARIGTPAIVKGHRGIEDQPCCAAASGALVLVEGDDGGLIWRRGGGAPTLARGMARLNRWWRQNFAS